MHVAMPTVRVSVFVWGEEISVFQVTEPPIKGLRKLSEGMEWMVGLLMMKGLYLGVLMAVRVKGVDFVCEVR